MRSRLCLAVFLVLGALPGLAQQTSSCSLPPIEVHSAKGNIFTEEQENQLGDFLAEQEKQTTLIVHDPALSAHLKDVGQRILAQLPTRMTYHFELIELSEANAFATPGGRIYISRKIVALMKSEDELAGLLAHEIGHLVTHQSAAQLSRELRQLFGTRQVSNIEEIRSLYNRRLDNQARITVRENEGEDQLVADRVAIEAMTRAGFNPAAFTAFFDRLADTHGKNSLFSDLFGTTRPDVARFRKMQKLVAAMPPACLAQNASAEPFTSWRKQVIDSDLLGTTEAHLPGLLWQRTLAPRLRPATTNARYSPDGKWLLAQNGGSIAVLSREPLAELFRIPAYGAERAQFSADSQAITFFYNTADPRIETWSVASRSRVAARELHVKQRCAQADISSDGQVFACLARSGNGASYEFNLVLYDTSSGEVLARSQPLLTATDFNEFWIEFQAFVDSQFHSQRVPIVYLDFSPDDRYVVASRDGKVFAYDLKQRTQVTLNAEFAKRLCKGFAFVAPGRVVARKPIGGYLAELRSFPDGTVLKDDLNVGGSILMGSSDPNIMMLKLDSAREYPLMFFDLEQNRIVFALKTTVSDTRSGEFIGERKDGGIAIHDLATGKPKGQVELSESIMGWAQSATFSSDGNWVAYSDAQRGGVWNLNTGERVLHLNGFSGSFLYEGMLHADIEKHGTTPRSVYHIRVPGGTSTRDEIKPGTDEHFTQYGSVLLETKSAPNRYLEYFNESFGSKWYSAAIKSLEARDIGSRAVLWTKSFSVPPDGFEVHGNAVAFLKQSNDDMQIDFHSLRTGSPVGSLKIKTNKGSFGIRGVSAVGNYFLVSDDLARVTAYSKAGQQVSRVFGTGPVLSENSQVLAVTSESQQLTLYDLPSGQRRGTLLFSQPHIVYGFDASGTQLLVLTADQTVYAFDVNKVRTEQADNVH